MKTIYFTLIALLVAVISLQSCNKNDNNVKPEFRIGYADSIPQEEYDIYSLVIHENYPDIQVVTVAQQTNTETFVTQYWYDTVLASQNPGFDTTVVENYKQANDSLYYFNDNFSADNQQIKVLTNDELHYIFQDKNLNAGWLEFHKEYPNSGSLLSFTRIGFNLDHTQAIFEISSEAGSLAGSGFIIYLVKENGQWVIKDRINTWIS